MDFFKKIVWFLRFGSMQDYRFRDAVILEYLEDDQVLNQTGILRGECSCNLILEDKVHLKIEGKLTGNVKASKTSVIEITGTYTGNLTCDLLIIKKSAVVEGDIAVDKLILSQGSIFNAKASLGIYSKARG